MARVSESKIFMAFLVLIVCSCATSTRETIAMSPNPPPKWVESRKSADCEPTADDRDSYQYEIAVSKGHRTRAQALDDAEGNARGKFAEYIGGVQYRKIVTTSTKFSGKENEVLNPDINSSELSRQHVKALVRSVGFPQSYVEKHQKTTPDGSTYYEYYAEVCAKISDKDIYSIVEDSEKQIAEFARQVIVGINKAQAQIHNRQFKSAILKLQTILNNAKYKTAEIPQLEDVSNLKVQLLNSLIIEVTSSARNVPYPNSASNSVEVKVSFYDPDNGKKLPAQDLPILLTSAGDDRDYESGSRTNSDGFAALDLPDLTTTYPGKALTFNIAFNVKELQQNDQILVSEEDISTIKNKKFDYEFNIQNPVVNFELNDFEFSLDLEPARRHYNEFSATETASNTPAFKKVEFDLISDERSYIRIYAVTSDGNYVELLRKEQLNILQTKKEKVSFLIPHAKRHSSFFILASERESFLFDQLKANARFTMHEFTALLKLFQNQEFKTSVIHEEL